MEEESKAKRNKAFRPFAIAQYLPTNTTQVTGWFITEVRLIAANT